MYPTLRFGLSTDIHTGGAGYKESGNMGNVICYLVDVIQREPLGDAGGVATYPIYYSIPSLNFAIWINVSNKELLGRHGGIS